MMMRIRGMPGSDIGEDTIYPDRDFSGSIRPLQGYDLKSGHERVLLHIF
jgi:hypothetical protein